MTLPDVAEDFQSHGFNVLLYDARSVGGSGGQPRNLLNPLQMAEDLSGVCFRQLQLVKIYKVRAKWLQRQTFTLM